jgi:ribosomal protein S18 acetylase RimI-like enzyme
MATVGAVLEPEVRESVSQLVDVFRFCAQRARRGATHSEAGLEINWMGTLWPFGNQAVISTPVADRADLEKRILKVTEFFRTKPQAGLLAVCESLLPGDLRPVAAEICASHGFQPVTMLTSMATEALNLAVRRLPALEFRQTTERTVAEALAILNARAYDVPFEWAQDLVDRADIWGDERLLAFVGYVNGRPASCAATFVIDRRLYVGFVATAPESQGKGYAEAVTRHSLEQAQQRFGVHRTVLHATAAGHPIYLRMGYHDVARFTMYSPPE